VGIDFIEVCSFSSRMGFVMYSYSTLAVRNISFTCRGFFFDDIDWPIGAKRVKFDKEIDRKRGTHCV